MELREERWGTLKASSFRWSVRGEFLHKLHPEANFVTLTRQTECRTQSESSTGWRLHLGRADRQTAKPQEHTTWSGQEQEKYGRHVQQCSECVCNPISLRYTPRQTQRIGSSFIWGLLFGFCAHSSPQDAHSWEGKTTLFKYSSLFVVFFPFYYESPTRTSYYTTSETALSQFFFFWKLKKKKKEKRKKKGKSWGETHICCILVFSSVSQHTHC